MADVPATSAPPDFRALGKMRPHGFTGTVVATCSCGNKVPFLFTVIAGRSPLKQQCRGCQAIVYVTEIHFDTTDLENQKLNVMFGHEMPNILKPV